MDNQVERAKLNASRKLCEVVTELAEPGFILGVGTGSTVRLFIEICSDTLRKSVLAASSTDTTLYLKKFGLRVVEPLSIDELDLYVDGADEVSLKLDMIKGHGGALFREKTLALLAKRRVYAVDYTKYNGVDYLYLKPIPVEVVPFALSYFLKALMKMGLYEASIRTGSGRYGPVVTDNGNYIVDLKPVQPLKDPLRAHIELKSMHGVVETGIFPAEMLVDAVVVGYPEKVEVILKKGELQP